jgi:ankyrin repeat protein
MLHPKKNFNLDIHQAVLNNDYEKVEVFLKNKVSPDKQTGNKNTSLHIAAMRKHYSVVKLLASYSANPNLKNFHGSTPLHIASYKKDNLKTLKLLLKMGADPNKTDRYGNTPLHIAARSHGNIKVIISLLKAGSNPNAMNNDFGTAYTIAKKNNHIECLEILNVYGAKTQRNILKTLSRSFHTASKLKKITLISFTIIAFCITIAIAMFTSGKAFIGILFAMLASLGVAILCLEEQYHKLQEVEKKMINNKNLSI